MLGRWRGREVCALVNLASWDGLPGHPAGGTQIMFYSRGPMETETQNQQATVFKTKGGNMANESTGGVQDLTRAPPRPSAAP